MIACVFSQCSGSCHCDSFVHQWLFSPHGNCCHFYNWAQRLSSLCRSNCHFDPATCWWLFTSLCNSCPFNGSVLQWLFFPFSSNCHVDSLRRQWSSVAVVILRVQHTQKCHVLFSPGLVSMCRSLLCLFDTGLHVSPGSTGRWEPHHGAAPGTWDQPNSALHSGPQWHLQGSRSHDCRSGGRLDAVCSLLSLQFRTAGSLFTKRTYEQKRPWLLLLILHWFYELSFSRSV